MTDATPHRWLYEWERQMYPFIMWHFGNMFWHDPGFGQEAQPSIFFLKGLTGKMYWDRHVMDRNARHLLKRFLAGELLDEFRRVMKADEEDIKTFADELQVPATPAMFRKEAALYKQQCVGMIRTFNRLSTEKLLAFVENTKDFKTLTIPEKKSVFELEREELRKISPDDEVALTAHAEKYGYLSCGYADEPPLTVEDFRQEMNAVVEKPEESRAAALERLDAPEEIRLISDALSELTYAKDQIRSYYNYLHHALRPVLADAARQLDVDIHEVMLFTPLEIAEALEKSTLDRDEIEKRKVCCVFYRDTGIDTILSGEEGLAFLRREIEETATSDELLGLSANPGIARGRVKIARRLSDISEEEGFVLVTPMTTPELVPLIKRCVAIVTDEGGITSHAAIISRELGKPCVIGMQTASRTLKDGDLVEVDATKGVVRRLDDG